jgi:hypothetical protein
LHGEVPQALILPVELERIPLRQRGRRRQRANQERDAKRFRHYCPVSAAATILINCLARDKANAVIITVKGRFI